MAVLAGALLGGRGRVGLAATLPALERAAGLLEDLLPAADALKVLLQDFRGVFSGGGGETRVSGTVAWGPVPRGCYLLEVLFWFPGPVGFFVPAFPLHLEARLALCGTSAGYFFGGNRRKDTHIVGNVVRKYLLHDVPAHSSVARVK